MTERFSSRFARVQIALAGLVFLVIGLGGLEASGTGFGQSIFAGFMVAVGGFFGYRSMVSPMVVVSPSSVRARSFLRSRTFALASLVSVDVAHGTTGPMSGPRDYLMFRINDGPDVAMRDLNARHRDGHENVVQEAARCINGLLSTR